MKLRTHKEWPSAIEEEQNEKESLMGNSQKCASAERGVETTNVPQLVDRLEQTADLL